MIQSANQQNPFPGMNPYLEQYWRDVHTRLMTYLCDQLQGELPEGLWATVEEEVTVDDDLLESAQRFRPDVHVAEAWDADGGSATATAAVAVAEPLVMIVPEVRAQRHVQIVEAGGRVVTAIEVLSATNKLALERRRAYRRKRRAFQDGGVNVVEIDLVRDGDYIVLAPEEEIPPSRRAPYIINVWRATRPDRNYAYPCPLRQPLPRIAVPLRPQDADVALDLQLLVDLCYERGRYHARLDYRTEPEPPLSPPDAMWADELLRAAGLR
jgi:hypothetical protein